MYAVPEAIAHAGWIARRGKYLGQYGDRLKIRGRVSWAKIYRRDAGAAGHDGRTRLRY